MSFYLIDTLGIVDDEWCLLDDPPKGIGLAYNRMVFGTAIEDAYPDDASIYMSADNPGIKLGSLLGNTLSYLIVSSPLRAAIEELCPKLDIEYLSFTLYNHKGRVHSTDYAIVNPVGSFDCLDLEASEILYLEEEGDPYDGEIVAVNRFVLNKKTIYPGLIRLLNPSFEPISNCSAA